MFNPGTNITACDYRLEIERTLPVALIGYKCFRQVEFHKEAMHSNKFDSTVKLLLLGFRR
jgi:hypothetical protein